MPRRKKDFAQGGPRLLGGLACFAAMYLTVYRPMGRLKDGDPTPQT